MLTILLCLHAVQHFTGSLLRSHSEMNSHLNHFNKFYSLIISIQKIEGVAGWQAGRQVKAMCHSLYVGRLVDWMVRWLTEWLTNNEEKQMYNANRLTRGRTTLFVIH